MIDRRAGAKRLLQRGLPLLLAIATLLGVAREVSFTHNQSLRLDALQAARGASARLAVLSARALAGGDPGPQAVSAAHALSRSLAEAIEAVPQSPTWLSDAPSMGELAAQWGVIAGDAARVAELSAPAGRMSADAGALEDALTGLRTGAAALLERVVDIEVKPAQARAVAQQLARVERMAASARALMAPGADLLAVADRLGRDAVAFGDVNTGLQNGAREQRITRIADTQAQDVLGGLGREFRQLVPRIESLLANTGARASLAAAAGDLDASLIRARELTGGVEAALAQRASDRLPKSAHLLWLAALSVLAIGASSLGWWRELRAERSLRVHAEEDLGDEIDALRAARDGLTGQLHALAGDMQQLAQGQVTVQADRAPPSDIAAADAFAALERVADRMRTHSDEGARMLRGSQLLSDLARALRDESRVHSDKVDQVGLITREMASGVDAMTRDGQALGDVARASGNEARRVNEAVGDTLRELSAVEAGAEECARRVARLESAAREMVAVRILIEDVSELGKLLSLNVAIQASADNAASRALSAFSDEVQRLADRARSAMVQIDLVHSELRDEAERASGAITESLGRARAAVGRAERAGANLKTLDESATRLEALGVHLVKEQRSHALRVTDVVRAITALHGLTGRLREQVDATVDSTMALKDAGALFDPRLGAPATLDGEVLGAQTPATVQGNPTDFEGPPRIVERH